MYLLYTCISLSICISSLLVPAAGGQNSSKAIKLTFNDNVNHGKCSRIIFTKKKKKEVEKLRSF